MLIELFALIFIFLLLILSYLFYESKDGHLAVYNSWYAWIIDLLAFLSGTYISIISFILYYDGYSLYILIPLFIAGSSQAILHVAKFIVRITSH